MGHVEIIREDIREAIRLIRARSAEWGIQQVGVMGASIGGYIAATAATLYHGTDRADFQILLYPVISMTDQLTHLPSRCRMLGENIPEAEKRRSRLNCMLPKKPLLHLLSWQKMIRPCHRLTVSPITRHC